MKKLIALFAFVFVCQLGYGQSINQLFNDLSQHKNTTKVRIGKTIMALAGLFGDTMGVDGVEVLEFSSCDNEVKAQFKETVRSLKDPLFDTLVNTSENGNRTKVMVRIEDNMIRELIVLTSGNNDALVRIKGKIKKSDIEKLVNEHS